MIGAPDLAARPVSVRRAETAAQFDAIRQLLAEFTAWDTAQTEAAGLDPGEFLAFYRSEGDEPLPGPYASPRGCLLLATCGDAAAGCIAFKPLSKDACELKRMYVREQFRGRRIGAALIEALLAIARGRGYKSMRLETTTFMAPAIALYASHGFAIRTPYYEIPSNFGPVTVFMERDLEC